MYSLKRSWEFFSLSLSGDGLDMSISNGLDSLVFGELGYDVRVVVDDGADLMVCVSKSELS